MTKVPMLNSFGGLLGVGPAVSGNLAWMPGVTDYDHSGGCRKDSPKGQCCQAGSKPCHCH
ncbi:hypothetical protein DEA8626_03454 [Defluviimonas aquaemixtae]|uniref:Uncharacterized protein n=1 Tax=Albidovulum aquaemixtae TaxID=1542388 RepID=A0A2R8BLX5_9RHOB|nr:hypothetical protein DEA8626_03454 [Defluviimonas aquaemixtae]